MVAVAVDRQRDDPRHLGAGRRRSLERLDREPDQVDEPGRLDAAARAEAALHGGHSEGRDGGSAVDRAVSAQPGWACRCSKWSAGDLGSPRLRCRRSDWPQDGQPKSLNQMRSATAASIEMTLPPGSVANAILTVMLPPP